MGIKNVEEIASWRLCVGCGACAYICTEKKVQLVNVIKEGIRPIIETKDCGSCDECIRVCPGYETSHFSMNGKNELLSELKEGWGTIIEVWQGYATDPEIRYSGSSGGVASAIALYCIEKEGMNGVLHIGPDSEEPWLNKTVFSRNRFDLLSRTGSRYSPASPCDKLSEVEYSTSPCIFIGKPCDVVGLRKSQLLRPSLDEKIGVTIGIFCAGTPSTMGTLELLKNNKVNINDAQEIRYRGKGWPGMFTVKSSSCSVNLSYLESWGFIQRFRPFRCYLCPDGTSEFADISCGDPWYREIKDGEHGYSLILIRTEKGRKILHNAVDAGYLYLEKANPEILEKSQRNLLLKRGTIWGKLIALKCFGIPIPKLEGFSLFRNWLKIPVREKARSIIGTVIRIIHRKYYKAKNIHTKIILKLLMM